MVEIAETRIYNNTAILLTGCIDPKGMCNTALQCADIRKTHYLEAIDFYLRETNLKIVFCENTNTDIFDEITSLKKYERLEYLTFQGNNYDKNRGKGCGEARIIKYAIEHSQYIQSVDYIIKITGRVKILNISNLLRIWGGRRKNLMAMVEFCALDYAKSICFLTSKDWLLTTVSKYGELLQDNKFDFEMMLCTSIAVTPGMRILPWFPIVDGICGGTNKRYLNCCILQRKINHYYTQYYIYKNRGKEDFLYAFGSRLYWLYYIVARKLYLCVYS